MDSLELPSQGQLFQRWIGKDIADVPKPAAVLDRAIIRRHCDRMKKTVKALGVGFRAHVKTHKVGTPGSAFNLLINDYSRKQCLISSRPSKSPKCKWTTATKRPNSSPPPS